MTQPATGQGVDRGAERGAVRGHVTAVRGGVVNVFFDTRLPATRSLLQVGAQGVRVEVESHLDEKTVRGLALDPTRGLGRGAPVWALGRPPGWYERPASPPDGVTVSHTSGCRWSSSRAVSWTRTESSGKEDSCCVGFHGNS